MSFDRYKLADRFTSVDFLNQLESLLPEGMAWFFDRVIIAEVIQDVLDGTDVWDDVLTGGETVQDAFEGESRGPLLLRLLSCFGDELARIEADAVDVVNQTDPGAATYLLEDWERVLGLPEKCLTLAQTVEERQAAAHAKLFSSAQTLTAQAYVDYAAALGYVITVEEFPPVAVGRRMGDRVGEDTPRMGGATASNSVIAITVVSGGDIEIIQCAINSIKPAHVTIQWSVTP